MIHGYVPNDFGCGIVVPLLIDRCGDVSKLDNYRAITISCVISKVFELCICDKLANFYIAIHCSLASRGIWVSKCHLCYAADS